MHEQSALTDITNIVKDAIVLSKLRHLTPGEMISKHGRQIRGAFKSSNTPVLICARNEEESLPILLFGLSMQTKPVRPVVVDNGSTDSTPDIARDLGADVLTEQVAGKMNAEVTGLRFVVKQPLILHTDADVYPMRTWANEFSSMASRYMLTSGGQVFSPIGYYGSLARDIVRNGVHTFADVYYFLKGNVRAHSPNGLIVNNSEGSLIANLVESLDVDCAVGEDTLIADQIRQLGGDILFHWSMRSLVFTSGDRYKDLFQLLRAVYDKSYQKTLYSSWLASNPNGYYYSYRDSRR